MQRLVFKMTVPAELSPSTGEFRQLRRKKLGEEYSLYFENNTSVYHSLVHWPFSINYNRASNGKN